MAPKLTEEEIDDLIYFSRAGEQEDLTETIKSLAERENASPAEIVAAAQDASNKSTCLHMATGNGHLGKNGIMAIWRLHMSLISGSGRGIRAEYQTNTYQKSFANSSHTSTTDQRSSSKPFSMNQTKLATLVFTGQP